MKFIQTILLHARPPRQSFRRCRPELGRYQPLFAQDSPQPVKERSVQPKKESLRATFSRFMFMYFPLHGADGHPGRIAVRIAFGRADAPSNLALEALNGVVLPAVHSAFLPRRRAQIHKRPPF